MFSWNLRNTNPPCTTPRNLSSTSQLSCLLSKKNECSTNRLHQSTVSRSLCSLTRPSTKQACSACSIHQSTRSLCSGKLLANSLQKNGECAAILSYNASAPLNNLSLVRNLYRIYYRPSALKRMRKHGLEKRLSKRSQKEILFRRIIKGRRTLSTFDRFMNEVPEIKKTGKRVNLFDPKRGYKSVLKRKHFFVFTEV